MKPKLNKKMGILVICACLMALAPPLYLSLAALDNQTYLPILFKQTTLTPTLTPTPTLKPPPVLLPNGDFEQGPAIWIQYSLIEWPLIVNEFPVDVYPYEGAWSAWLGGDNDEFALLQQQVNLPADLPYLSYWYWIKTSDSCGNDFGYVFVEGTEVKSYDLCAATGGWVQEVIDLRSYVGASVNIQFIVETSYQWTSSLFIDYVAFQANIMGLNRPFEAITDPDGGVLKRDVLGK